MKSRPPEPEPARPLAPLREPEDLAHAILAHIDEVVYVVRPTQDPLRGTVEYVSERALTITGFEPAAFRRDPELWFRLLHPEDVPAVQASTLAVMERREGCTRVYRLRNGRTGEYLWVEDRIVPMLEAGGAITGLVGAARDVTGRKRTEEALRESRETLQAQFQGLPIPTYCWRRVGGDFVLFDYNAAADAFTGGTVAQLMGATARAMYSDVPGIVDDLERCFAERTPIRRQVLYRFRTTGETRPLWVTYGFVPPDTVLIHTQDLSEQLRAKVALQDSQLRLQAVFDTALDAILLADDQARYLDANPAACALLGYSREELLRMTVWDITPAPGREMGQDLWRQFIAAGTQAGEYTVHRKDGTTRETEYRAVANILPGLHLSALRDITERKRAQADIEARARQQAAVADLGQRALSGIAIEALMSETVALVAATLGVEYAAVLEMQPGGRELVVRAMAGCEDNVGERVVVSAGGSLADRALASPGAVVIPDLRSETRFAVPPALQRLGVVSGLSVAIRGEERPFGVLGAHTTTRRDFAADDVRFLESIAHVLASAVLRKRHEVVRARLLDRVISAQEDERRHLARELHDEVGQLLTGLKLMLETGEPKACASALTVVHDLLAQVREISMSLRPAMLDDLGLVPALLWLFERFSGQTQVRVDFQQAGSSRRFSRETETAVFRIVQEALTNVARHATVSEVKVRLWAEAERLGARIEDSGRGFEVAAALAGPTAGLGGMRERAEVLGGQLTIESAPGSGTRLAVELPLAPEAG